MRDYSSGNLLFLDESGAHLGMTRTYARAPRGERSVGSAPNNPGTNITVIACVGERGVVAPRVCNEGMNDQTFLAYVTVDLAPQLRRGDIVVMDNLRTHKVAGIREAIEKVGAVLLYLPPYSPDFSPIENCWSKIKSILRSEAPRTLGEFLDAICLAINRVTKVDIRGWFQHCGYCVTDN